LGKLSEEQILPGLGIKKSPYFSVNHCKFNSAIIRAITFYKYLGLNHFQLNHQSLTARMHWSVFIRLNWNSVLITYSDQQSRPFECRQPPFHRNFPSSDGPIRPADGKLLPFLGRFRDSEGRILPVKLKHRPSKGRILPGNLKHRSSYRKIRTI
jgi:hypothetical protein